MMPGAARNWISPVLAAAVATAIAANAPSFPLDDAYITLHNARALLAGGWDATYGTSALTGATSVVHLLLVAGFGLVLPLPAAAWLVGIVSAALYAAGLDRMAVQAGVSRITIGAAGLLTAYMLFNLVNGLETGLALAAMTWSLVLIDHRRLPLLLGIMPFVRPEFALLSGLLMLRCCWRDRVELRLLAANLAWFAAGALPWLSVIWVTTGMPFPATASTKVAFMAETRLPLLRKLGIVGWVILISGIGPLVFGALGLRAKPGGLFVALFVVMWLGVIVATYPSGINHNNFRYLMLAVPALAYGATALLAGRFGRIASGVFLFWALFSSLLGSLSLYSVFRDPRYAMLGIDAALLPRGAHVLLHDAGYLAWLRPDLRLVDMVGLKTPSSAAAHARFTAPTGDTRRAMATIAAGSDARILIALSKEKLWAALLKDLASAGWRLDRINPPGHAYAIYRMVQLPARPGPAAR